MRGRQTSRAYCHQADCQGVSGVASHFTGDTWTDPGWWEPETCPHCDGSLFDSPLAWEDPMEALADELEQTGALDLKTDERRDVDWLEVYSVIQKELSRQAHQRRRADAEAKARHQEYLRAVEAGEREPYPDLPF